ncbi:MAG: DNA-protecting protein DprA, partial [Paludibacter sp.]
MSNDILQYQIGLTLMKGIGTQLAKNLIAYVGSVEGVFKEKKQNLEKIPGIGSVLSNQIVKSNVLKRAEKEILFIEKNKIETYFFTDKNYPFRLKECYDAPIMLYFKGNQSLSNQKMIGIVGTRNITDNGKKICTEIVEDIVKKLSNVTLVSGLAYGVDICSHKVAVKNKLSNIGVLGHGLDRIYPAIHRSIAKKIIENGGLLSEYISETNPDRQNFVKRNRIIAGLCDAIIIIESDKKGGSLITAEYANNYNRDVFAIPGRVDDTFSKGCNNLIKYNKAGLITSTNDLIRAMNWEEIENSSQNKKQEIQLSLFENLTSEEQTILSKLKKEPNGINVNEL